MRFARPLAVLWVGLALASACGGGGKQTLTVFAASSLTDPFGEAGRSFEAAHAGTEVRFSFGGSPALRTQLEEGAQADLLATADEANMRAALDKGLVRDAGTTFVTNRLTIIVPKSNPAAIATLADLARPGIKLVLAGADVPVGAYARQAIDRAAAGSQDFSGRVEANVVSEEPNVKAVVAKVQLGEADAGIVYATDVTPGITGEVTAIEIPDAYNVVASYPIAITSNAKQTELARQFIEFLRSDEGQAILERFGFIGVK